MSKCSNPELGKLLYAYELNLLTKSERAAFEIHIIECESCYKKAVSFKSTSYILKNNEQIKELVHDLNISDNKNALEADNIIDIKKPKTKKYFYRSFIVAAVLLLTLILKPWHIVINPSDDIVAAENRIAIMYFENISNQEEYNWYREGVTNLLITDLAESNYLQVVSSQRLNDILIAMGIDSSEVIGFDIASQIAKKLNSRWLLMGHIMFEDEELYLTTQLIDVNSGIVKSSQKVGSTQKDNIFSLVDKLTVEIKNDLDLNTDFLNENDPKITNSITNSEMAYKLYLHGIDNLSRFYKNSAQEDFKQVISLDSSFAMAYYYMSKVTDNSEAIYYAREALKRSGNIPKKDQLFIKSRVSILTGDKEEAIEILQKIVKRYPDEKEAYYNLGRLNSLMMKYDDAIINYEKVLEIDPNYKLALNQLAYSYNKIGNFDKSLELLDRYISLAPEEPNPYDSKGDILASHGNIDMAIIAYEKALVIEPGFIPSINSLILINLQKGDYEQSKKYIIQIYASDKELFSSAKNYYETLLLIYQGQINNAMSSLEKISDGKDFDSQLLYRGSSKRLLAAKLNIARKNYQEAIINFEKFFKYDSSAFKLYKSSYIVEYLMTLCDLGMPDIAYQAADSFLIDYQGLDDSIIVHDMFYGSIEFKAGNYTNAVIHLENVVKEPTSPLIETMLGLTYLKLEQYDNSIKLLSRYHESFKKEKSYWIVQDIKSYYYLGLAYQQVNQTDDAIKQFEIFFSKWKDTDTFIFEIKDAEERLHKLKNINP